MPVGNQMTMKNQNLRAPHRAGVRVYGRVWRIPGATSLFIGGLIGRIPNGMIPLALILLVAGETGSYSRAGTATAGFALASILVNPFLGRLADRFRPVSVLVATGVVFPFAVAGVIAAAMTSAPLWLLVVSCMAMGIARPPLYPIVRGAWSELTRPPRQELRGSVFALEAMAIQLVFILGPLLVGLVTAVASAAVALAVAALLAVVGTACVAFGRVTRAWRPLPRQHRVRGLGAATAPGMPQLLAVSAAMAAVFGAVNIAVPAFAAQHAPGAGGSLAGLLLGVFGTGALVGSFWFGTRRFGAPLPTQWAWALAGALAGAAAGGAALVVAPTVTVLAVMLPVVSFLLGPALIVENILIARVAEGTISEAYAWQGSIALLATSDTSALGGILVDHHGGAAAFLLGAAALATGAAVAALPRSPLRRAAAELPESLHPGSGQ